jgi:hypothetical protein
MTARRDITRLALGAALFLVPLVPRAAAARSDSALASYRDFARTPAATRLLALARAAMESHWSAAAADTSSVPDWPGAPPSQLYLSLVAGRATRACIGRPPAGPLAACVRALAAEALVADPRHPPVRRDELARLRIVIAFAGEGEEIADPMSVNPAREGLLISSGGRSVAFLPGEARTVAWALRAARRAGLLAAGTPAGYVRFPVVVITESPPARERGEDSHEDE